MDLKIKEVSSLLNVDIATIEDWIQSGAIPAYQMGNEWRFHRADIEKWMIEQKGPPTKSEGKDQFSLYRAIFKGIVIDQAEGETKEEVIRSATKKICQELQIDHKVLTDLLLERENLAPTALGHGIAVPHTRDFLLHESFDVVAVVYPKHPIDFQALDSEPVTTLFFLLASDGRRHLHLLSKIAHLATSPHTASFLKKHPSKTDLLTYVKAFEGSLTN